MALSVSDVLTMTTKSTQSIFFSTQLKLGRSCTEIEEQTLGSVKLSAANRDSLFATCGGHKHSSYRCRRLMCLSEKWRTGESASSAFEYVSARGVQEPVAHHRPEGTGRHHRLGDEAVDGNEGRAPGRRLRSSGLSGPHRELKCPTNRANQRFTTRLRSGRIARPAERDLGKPELGSGKPIDKASGAQAAHRRRVGGKRFS